MEKIKFYKDESSDDIIVVEFDKNTIYWWDEIDNRIGKTRILQYDKELWFIEDEIDTKYIDFIYGKLYGKN